MTSLSRLRRATLILLLLPQLLVLGLGHGVVVCVAPGGHMEIEMAGSNCCSEEASSASHADGESGLQDDDSDCGPCSDLAILLDSKRPDEQELAEDSPVTSTTLPDTCHSIPGNFDPARFFALPIKRVHEPPHLISLRSVLLRC